jgi:hypothetical protein
VRIRGLQRRERVAVRAGVSDRDGRVAGREETGTKARLFTEFEYQAQTWSHPRRVIGKAERMPEGENLRFIVTNIADLDPEAAYDYYTERGQSENFIKDLKNVHPCHFSTARNARRHPIKVN